jgi:hypothetical protein
VAITSADVLLIAPELSAVTAGQWTALIADVYLQLDSDTWGTWLDLGAKYLAAHAATLTKRSGVAGAIQSEAAGSVSRSYAVAPEGSGLLSTSYGQEFSRLQRQIFDARGPWVL